MSVAIVSDEQVREAGALAAKLCSEFNEVVRAGVSLHSCLKAGTIQVGVLKDVIVPGMDMGDVQRAFLVLSDKMEHDNLHFISGNFGSVWADFVDTRGVAWRAALDVTEPEKRPWQIVLYPRC